MDNVELTTTSADNVEKCSYGASKVLGLDVQFSKMLGDVIVENYLNQLTEDDMQLIITYMTQDLFDYETRHDYDTHEDIIRKVVREDWETTRSTGFYGSVEKHKSVGTQIKEIFNNRFKEAMQLKIQEIIASEEYQNKIDNIAHEIIDYCVEGYKEDLKNSIREKLIGNVMNNDQHYGGISLQHAINEVVQSYFPR